MRPLLLLVLALPAAVSAGPPQKRLGIMLGWDTARNTRQHDIRTETTDGDLVCGVLYRPGGRWYAEAAAGCRAASSAFTAGGLPYNPWQRPSLHIRTAAAYTADTFSRTELNIVCAAELALDQWYDDSLYVQPRARAAAAGIRVISPEVPYRLSYAYGVLIPKLFLGLEPNIALNANLRLVCRYGFELRYLSPARRLEFSTAGGQLDTDEFRAVPLNDAHLELGRRFTLGLQYLF